MTRDAEKLLDEKRDFGNRYAEVEAWRVPKSERYPGGIRYSMQSGTNNGRTILRYDNFPDHPNVDRHHKHTADGAVEEVDFQGLWPLFRAFVTEVKEFGHDW